MRKVPVTAPRGFILDRNGVVLAENEPSFTLLLYRRETKDLDASIRFVAELFNRPFDEMKRRVERDRSYYDFVPVVLQENLTVSEVGAVAGARARAPRARRPEDGAPRLHAGDRRRAPPRPARRGDGRAGRRAREGAPRRRVASAPGRGDRAAGRRGLLPGPPRGRLGLALVRDRLVRPRGRRVRPRRPDAGQHAPAHDRRGPPAPRRGLLRREGRSGRRARPEDGRGPRARLGARVRPEPLHAARDARRVGRDPHGPEPARSTTASSRTSTRRARPGSRSWRTRSSSTASTRRSASSARAALTFYGRPFRCHGTHGSVDLATALQVSCDSYFYTMGKRLGIDAIAETGKHFGFGRATGIDLAHEKAGIVPSSEWSVTVRKHPWYAGETISVAIGQGPVLVSALQLARALCGIANADGALPTPHLFHIGENVRYGRALRLPARREGVRRVGGPPARRRPRRPLARREPAGRDRVRLARRGPRHVRQDRARSRSSARRRRRRATSCPSSCATTAGSSASRPKDDPQIVVVVFAEHGEHGASAAAPLAAKMCAYWVTKRRAGPPPVVAQAGTARPRAGRPECRASPRSSPAGST